LCWKKSSADLLIDGTSVRKKIYVNKLF